VYGDFAGTSVWDTGGHANSLYFEWLADTGLVGTALFGWLVLALLRRASLGLKRPDAHWPWRLGLLGSLAAWFLHGLFDYFYEPLGTNVAFWLLAALALAAAVGAQPPQPSGRASACASAST
jgi:O-antigen ligase